MTDRYAEIRAALDAATPGPWRKGKCFGAVVADKPTGGPSGSDHVEAYGGHLVGESMSPANIGYIAACYPEAIRALLADADRAKQLEAENARLQEALSGAVALATKAHGHWDSDQDTKVGKILLAMAGALPGYDQQADAIHAALAQKQGEKHDNQD